MPKTPINNLTIMEKLYLGGYLKTDKLAAALHYAKINHRLLGVDDVALRDFLSGFERIKLERRSKYLDKIDHREMEEILHYLTLNHNDHLNDKQLGAIGNILLDENFQFTIY